MIRVELARIIISDNNEPQIIFLKEAGGERSLPIVIGRFEAIAIDRLARGRPSSRPLTHDLLAALIGRLGGILQDVVIDDPRDHTYPATLRIRRKGRLIRVDARPSDAIAVALALDAPIYLDG
ncbi:bifunctional nuclease family protein [Tundrisphaera sp. TA3]|uniref:bifunctional nuclease family protein n=1 Tax=Tundrisphaera sp. TA3 TaxID=3435775 RepID=UPI003EBCC806